MPWHLECSACRHVGCAVDSPVHNLHLVLDGSSISSQRIAGVSHKGVTEGLSNLALDGVSEPHSGG